MYLGRLSDAAVSAFDQSQQQLATAVARLSTGLRINTAADDPSGLAIADTLQSKAMGLDQGQISMQTAVNAISVADSAMADIESILQRMRALIVQGRSNLLSDSDRSDINDELTSLTQEIDTIAQKTTFNGQHLLDGSLSSASAQLGGQDIVVNGTLASGLPLLDPTQLTSIAMQQQTSPYDFIVDVDSYDSTSGLLNVTYELASPDAGTESAIVDGSDSVQILAGQNYNNFWNSFPGPVPPGVDINEIDDQSGQPLIDFAMNNLSSTDVGVQAFVYTTNAVPAGDGAAHVALGDQEGDTVSLSIPAVSAADLNVSDVVVSSDDTVTEGSEYRVDAALQAVGTARAQLGAQTVSLQDSISEASTEDVNLTAAQSSIRDLDIASESTTFTKLQIQTELGSKLLASLNSLDTLVFQLFSANFA